MDPRFSAKVYPRKDNVYKGKKSLNFDLIRSKVFTERVHDNKDKFMEWIAFALVGAFTGLTAAIMSNLEETITTFRRKQTEHIIHDGEQSELINGWLFFTGISAAFVFAASFMTVFWGPGANGSGIAELMGYFNGINYPDMVGFETFVTKIFGVILAVCGGLCIGKEGPLAHIGAIVGAVVCYLPLPRFEWLRNDWNKRNMMVAGCSAGVSAAFGAPIGGALFAFECSKPNTFWKFSLIWKVFLCCTTSVLTLAVAQSLVEGEGLTTMEASVLKFGSNDVNPPFLEVIPEAFILGIICGVLGSVFVIINSNMGLIRKKWIT